MCVAEEVCRMSSLVVNTHFVGVANKQFGGYLWKIGGEIIPSTYFEQTQLIEAKPRTALQLFFRLV